MNPIPSQIEQVSFHVTDENAKEGVALMGKLIGARQQFAVAPDDTGWTISYFKRAQLEEQPKVSA